MVGLCCCTQAFSGCSWWELLFLVVWELPFVATSLVEEHPALKRGLSICGKWA